MNPLDILDAIKKHGFFAVGFVFIFVYLQKSAGTTARTADIDYLYLKAKFTTPR